MIFLDYYFFNLFQLYNANNIGFFMLMNKMMFKDIMENIIY